MAKANHLSIRDRLRAFSEVSLARDFTYYYDQEDPNGESGLLMCVKWEDHDDFSPIALCIDRDEMLKFALEILNQSDEAYIQRISKSVESIVGTISNRIGKE